MSDNGKKSNDDAISISSSELKYILDVNKKVIEIHIENAHQHELTLKELAEVKKISAELIIELRQTIVEKNDEIVMLLKEQIKPKIDDTDKNPFRLTVILGFVGLATIAQIIQMFFHK